MKLTRKLTALLLALAMILTLCAPALAEELPAEAADAAEEFLALEEGGDDDSDLESEVFFDDIDESDDADDDAELIPDIEVEADFEEDIPVEEDDPEDDPLAEAAETDEAADTVPGDISADGDVVSFELTLTDSLDDGTDPDALFSGYVDQQFGQPGIAENRHVGLTSLSGANLKLYKKLASFGKSVAAGNRTSTTLSFAPSAIGCSSSFTLSQVKASSFYSISLKNVLSAMKLKTDKVISTLQADYPYQFFWFDKTRGWSVSASLSYSYATSKLTVSKLKFSFHVCEAYSSGTYKVRSSKLSLVQTAKKNAQAIVDTYAGYGDYNKLKAYANRICQLTDYNDDAVYYNYAYGDPWQLIYVFDGNSSTNVVCEGYSKAFKYLCDLSTFQGNVYCYLAQGDVYFSNGGGGAHMWNVVTMPDGKNYLVDVTHTDIGSSGSGMNTSNHMFLRHASWVNSEGYSYDVYRSNNSSYSTYIYDDVCKASLPASLRRLSTTAYSSSSGTLAVQSLTLTAAKTKLVVGDKMTITPSYTPYNADPIKLYWSSSNKKVATVSSSGVVTAKGAGTVKISVRTWNEKTASITLTVKKSVKPTKITLNYTGTYTLDMQYTLPLKVTFSPWNGRSKLTWTSSNKKVATVSKNGLVTPTGEGNTTITVKTANGKKASLKVTVFDPNSPDYVYVYCGGSRVYDGGSCSVLAGYSAQFSATAYRYDGRTATQRFAWKSSNTAVATINSSGKLTTKKYGTTTITLTASGKLTTRFTVTVKRNRIVFMSSAPTSSQISSVGSWDIRLKSVEIVNSNKVVVSYYLINRLGLYSNYLKDLSTTLKVQNGSSETAFLSRKVSKINVKCYKNKSKLFKITYTGSQIKNLFNLNNGVSIGFSFSGAMNYRVS